MVMDGCDAPVDSHTGACTGQLASSWCITISLICVFFSNFAQRGHTAAARGHFLAERSIPTKTQCLLPSREAYEEAGISPEHLDFKAVFSDDHGNWRYDTVIAHASPGIDAFSENAESDALRWVSTTEVHEYELHPGLRSSWPSLHRLLIDTFQA